VRQALGVAVVVASITVGIVVSRATAKRDEPQQASFELKTFDPQLIFNARFAPDGRTIVFSSALEGNSPGLFVSRPDGSVPQALMPRTHLLSVSSTGELAVLTDASYIRQRLFRGTLARMAIGGTPHPWLEHVREADWAPDGSTLAVIHDLGLKDQLEYPIGTVLYQTSGYLSDPRVSPDGSHIAFLEHPARFDNRGRVKVVNRVGSVVTLTGEYWGVEGLVWTPDGKTILHSVGQGLSWQIHSVSLANPSDSRVAMPSDGRLLVLDGARDGRWLVTRITQHLSIRVRLPGASAERELPWLGFAVYPHLSSDGRLLLFTDQSESAGPNYLVRLRNTDGSPAARLGEGLAVGLSPDGTRALARIFDPPQSVIYPLGPGEPVRLTSGPLERSGPRQWFPDGKRVIVCGNEPSKQFRCYEQNVTGGLPKPLMPEGLDAGPIAPNGRTIVAIAPDGSKQLLSLADNALRPAPRITPDDEVVGWSQDSRSLFIQRAHTLPARIERVDLATGKGTLVGELAPPDRVGLVNVFGVSVINDGQAYAYHYWKRVSSLFVTTWAR
jgi:Tol biopolymer transport system component